MSAKEPLAAMGQLVPELPVADVEGAQRHYEDIEASYRELQASGANIVEPLELKPWGLTQFTVEDLDGNRFYFHHE